jgi:hypothetical protein
MFVFKIKICYNKSIYKHKYKMATINEPEETINNPENKVNIIDQNKT